jgi:hypothetical protein
VRYPVLLDGGAVGPDRIIPLTDLSPVVTIPETPEEREAILNLNVVLRYEFLPGSVLYAVFTRSQAGGGEGDLSRPRLDFGALGNAPAEQVFLIKASYYFAR